MEKLNITKGAREQFKNLGVDVINNANGAVYLHGSMRNVAMVISKLLVLNPGVRVQCMNSATVKIVNEEKSAIVNTVVIFEDINPQTEDEWFIRPFTYVKNEFIGYVSTDRKKCQNIDKFIIFIYN